MDEPDALTLVHRFVYGNRDLTRLISEELGYVSAGFCLADDSMSISGLARTNIRGVPRCSPR